MECKVCGKWFGTILKSDLCPTCERAYNRIFSGIQYDRLRELSEADKEGRVVVLPCKIDQRVYFHAGDEVGVTFVREIHIGDRGMLIIDPHFCKRILGKTVFLTREEAEAALKGGGTDD